MFMLTLVCPPPPPSRFWLHPVLGCASTLTNCGLPCVQAHTRRVSVAGSCFDSLLQITPSSPLCVQRSDLRSSFSPGQMDFACPVEHARFVGRVFCFYFLVRGINSCFPHMISDRGRLHFCTVFLFFLFISRKSRGSTSPNAAASCANVPTIMNLVVPSAMVRWHEIADKNWRRCYGEVARAHATNAFARAR